MTRSQKIIFAISLATAAVLRLWRLPAVGLHHDAALNAMRALGWFDFLVGIGQTGPLVWFGYIPWWANLSFHDHPFLSFLIQKLFFTVFGDSAFVALLPFVLSGIVTTFLIYWLLARFADRSTALVGAGLFAVSSLSIWASRSGYLEGLSVLFITAATGALLLYIDSKQNKYWYAWAIFVSLALLIKYTSIFLLPAAAVFLFIFDRRVVFSRKAVAALLLMLVMLSPVIVYNIFVFQERGHFDAAFSSMVGMSPEDYSTLQYRSVNANFVGNLYGIFEILVQNVSLPLFILYCLALVASVLRIVKRDFDKITIFLSLNILFIILMFSFSGAAERFLAILIPFFSLLTAWQLWWLLRNAVGQQHRKILIAAMVLVLAVEAVFAANTSLLPVPFGKAGMVYAPGRSEAPEFVELDKFLRTKAFTITRSLERINSLSDERMNLDFAGKEIIIFDERADWFSSVWYVDRYKYYYGVPFVYPSDLSRAVEGRDFNIFSSLRSQGANGFWLVVAEGSAIRGEHDPSYDQVMDSFKTDLLAQNIMPAKEIRSPRGELLFSVFHFQ